MPASLQITRVVAVGGASVKVKGRRTMKGIYTLGKYVPNIAASCWVAPNAAVVGNVIMKEHSSVWFGATVRGDNLEPISIGAR
jgi:hypothetical protein